MDIRRARQLLRDAKADGERFYPFAAYERLVDELYELLECDRKEIDASKVGVTLVDTSTLCITGMHVALVLEPKGSHDTDPFAKQD